MGLFSFFRRTPPEPPVPADPAIDPSVLEEETTEVETKPISVDRPASGGETEALRWAVYSITGNFRENNEDSVGVDQRGRFFLVADGMGGQTAGEKASEMAVELVSGKLQDVVATQPTDDLAESLRSAVSVANSEIMALGNVDPAFSGMGTTLVSLAQADPAAGDEAWVIGSIGDSRVYRLRDGQFEQITRDHSLTQALIDAGTITPEEAKVHRYKNMLVKYLGAKEGQEGGETFPVEMQPDDRFLLCSDGVTDGLDDDSLAKLLRQKPIDAVRAIVKAAQDGGSRDNISCIVVERKAS